MSKEKPATKICKHCQTEISYGAKVCPQCRKKQGGKVKWIIIGVVILMIVGAAASGGDDESNSKTELKKGEETIEANPEPKEKGSGEESSKENEDKKNSEEKDKYIVGDTYENKNLKMTYTNCYEFTDYEEYNAPSEGNKIICAEFEFENIGKSDETVMYTDFNGYADGYEVEQSYAPDGTGMDFSLSMSPGRKGTGKIAFEVPIDATEVEIEFSPSFWSSEKVIFTYQ